jgi:hypothetical protein
MKIPLLVVALLVLTGCSSLSARKTVDLTRYKHIYVEHRLADNHRVDEEIVAELKTLGYDASCGVLTMKPDGVDAIITYEDRWTWDFTTYLIELNLAMRDARVEKQVAQGYFHQAPLVIKSSKEVIREVLTKLFKPA